MLASRSLTEALPTAGTTTAAPRWTFWVSRGTLAVIDQALIAASNFVISILLARWLTAEQYGGYALAFAIFLLLSLLYQSLILEPQRIFGATEHANHSREYTGVLLVLHGGLALLTAVVLGTYASILHMTAPSGALSGALAGMAIAGPCILLLWLARGAFYVRMRPQGAVAGSSIYCAVALASIFVVYEAKLLSAFAAFLVMAIAATVSSLVLFRMLEPVLTRDAIWPRWRAVVGQHWQYGRWILVSSLLGWLTGDIYYPVVTAFSGLQAAGELKALQNFSLPITQALNALAIFVLPHAARVGQERTAANLNRLTWKVSGLFAAGAIAYWISILAVGRQVIHAVYGSNFSNIGPMLPWMAAASIPWTVAYVPAMSLRAIRSSESVLMMYVASSIIAVVVGIPATRAYGLQGALYAMVLSNVAALGASLLLFNRKQQDTGRSSV